MLCVISVAFGVRISVKSEGVWYSCVSKHLIKHPILVNFYCSLDVVYTSHMI